MTSSPAATLTVNVPPTITVPPESQTTNVGANVSFSVTATGTAPLSYQWRQGGVPLSGQTSNVLVFSAVTTNDAGSYDVVVTNVAGSVTSSPVATLTVNVPPVITVPPESQTTNVGASVNFTVTATATGTAPLSYQWRRGGVPLSGQTSNILVFSAVTTNDAGSYDVVVTNVAGSVTSSPAATLTVNVPPVITVPPVSQTTNEGVNVSFSVTATGTGPLSYQWRRGGTPLSGQTSNELVFSAVTTNDAGSYDVVVTNVAGSVTSSPVATLTVNLLNVPPTITVPPESQTTNAGANVSFSVTATGTAPLSYQWRQDGVPLSGQTSNVLVFSAVTTNDAGSYDVVVTNVAGSVTSSPAATLTVNVPPSGSVGADAVVLVNSASAKYLDFRNYLQPYLDHFGVPYSVLDIRTNAVGTNVDHRALIIIGHDQLDPSQVYLDAAAQAVISLAVSNGTGLVNFDSHLSGGGGSSNYTYVQDVFGFTYTNSTTGNNVTFPATETNSQLHYITALHTNTGTIGLSNNMTLAGLGLPTNATAVALSGGKPLLIVTRSGRGRAVQWASYDWIKVAVKGPMFGLDDLVWRSLVWSARKPFVLRGLPHHVVMRIDDVAGPANNSGVPPMGWVRVATEVGFKPHLELFYNCLDAAEISVIRAAVTNGQATASIHSQGCGGGSFFFFDHAGKKGWPDNVMAQNFAAGTQWLQNNGIPHSKVICPHYSELGTNIFAGLQAWGVEYTSIEIIPGQVEYAPAGSGAPWLVAGPFRKYETPLEGQSPRPFFYADFLPIPNHPEFDGQFFNCYTEVRDDAPCQEWCPSNDDIAGSIARGVRQLKRSFDSMAVATLYGHDYYLYPTVDNSSMATSVMTTNNWRAILQGITNAIAGYQPEYVTIEHAFQYVRATRTANLVAADFDYSSGRIGLTLTGKADLVLQTQVFFGEDRSITNTIVPVPAFTNSITVSVPVVSLPPAITNQPQSQIVIADHPVEFTVGASSGTPVNYQWQLAGTNLPGATNAVFSLPVAELEDAGEYSVIVSNAAGATVSANALLTVIVPPYFKLEPHDITVVAGSVAAFAVSAQGSQPLEYQWRFNGTNIADATNTTFELAAAQLEDVGEYSVTASNFAGPVLSSSALLTVLLPPEISEPPRSQTVAVGANVTFSVAVTGSEPMTYQWTWNRTNILDATNAAYAVVAAQLGDAGAYAVTISNAAAVVTSSNALLTVLQPPAISDEPPSQTVPAGTNVLLTLAATGSQPLSYQWFKNSTNLVSAATNTLTLLNVKPEDAGDYTVVVTNAAGSATSSVAVLTVTLDAPLVLRGRREGNWYVIAFNSITGATYRVEYKKNLADPAWFTLTNLTAVATNTETFDAVAANQRYYRAILNPTPLPAPAPPVLQITVSNRLVILAFNSTPGQSYRVEYQTAFTDSAWTTLTNLTAVDTTTICYDTLGAAARYYRVVPIATLPPEPPVLTVNVASNQVVLTFNSTPGQSYRVEYKTALDDGGWSTLTNLTAVDTTTVCYDVVGATPRYYRVVFIDALPEIIRLSGRLEGDQFILDFNAVTGRSYAVEYSGGLGVWSPLTNVTALTTKATFADPLISTQRFYRVRSPAD